MKDESIELKERSSLEIAERTLALVAIIARAQQQDWVGDWARQFNIHDYFSDEELGFFDTPAPDHQIAVNFSWKAESLVALVWSLGDLREMPPLSEQFWVLDTDFIKVAMRNPNSFRFSATKRPSEEINEMDGFLYHQHWRVRDKQLGFNVGAAHPLAVGELPVDQLNSSVVLERRYGLSWIVGWGENWDDVPTDT
ncbi:DUF4272 domain-containing protein [soil metagenome]